MAETVFFRLLASEDKGGALAAAVDALREGKPDNPVTYAVEPQSFRQVPGTPFAYWVSERIRRLFTELPPFESEGRMVRVGLQTSDDFRFVRAWWEVPAERILDAANGPDWRADLEAFQTWCRRRTHEGKRWAPFAKGGEYSPYYADIHLVVNWEREGAEMRAFTGSVVRNPDYYFRPGLTWPRRTNSNFGIRVLHAGCVFADKGPAAFVATGQEHAALGLLFSKAYQSFLELSMAAGDETQSGTPSRSYEVGIVQRLPWPSHDGAAPDRIADAVSRVLEVVRKPDAADETTHLFRACPRSACVPLQQHVAAWIRELEQRQCDAIEEAARIDEAVCRLFGVDTNQREVVFGQDAGTLCALPDREPQEEFDAVYVQSIHSTIRDKLDESGGNRSIAVKSFYVSRPLEVLARVFKTNPRCIGRTAAERGLIPDGWIEDHAMHVVAWCAGTALGRWDVRLAVGDRPAPDLPDPFDPLPVCPPGMLTDDDGLPARRSPADYPLRISWDGVLVDDPGHQEDVIARVREVIGVIWQGRADDIYREAVEILDPGRPGRADLRPWFRREFFARHIKTYSKSRRKAPIYWELTTPSHRYAVWLYYHRLTKDTFYKVQNDYVKPKLDHERRKLDRMRADAGPEPTRSQRVEIDRQETFVGELKTFAEETERIAPLFSPDLNDGVIINFAPLWRLVPQHKAWQKECKRVWDKLVVGDYDWSHLAMHLWPERVVPKCRTDASLAIAHGLEDVFWQQGEKGKWVARREPSEGWDAVIERLIAERTSPAVKAALKGLLEAPAPAGNGQRRKRTPRRRTRVN